MYLVYGILKYHANFIAMNQINNQHILISNFNFCQYTNEISCLILE